MGMDVNTGQISGTVTANVTIPTTATKPLTLISGSGVGTIGTVGAGKVWKIILMQMSVGTGASQAEIKLNDVANQFVLANAAGSVTGQSCNIVFDYSACPVLTAGQTVKTNGSGTINMQTVGYIEETA